VGLDSDTWGIVFLLAVAASTSFSLASAIRYARRYLTLTPLMLRRRMIASLNLDSVRARAMDRQQWSPDFALVLEGEYRDFLILIAENPGAVLTPWSEALDLFWHEHLLDTARYSLDCKRIFGRVIRHDANLGQDPYRHESTIQLTRDLRETQLRAREERQKFADLVPDEMTALDGFDVVTWGCGSVNGDRDRDVSNRGGPSSGNG
jgi:hypothetical protein